MITYLFSLVSRCGQRLTAACTLQRRVAHVHFDSPLWSGQALAFVIWLLIKRMELPDGEVPLRMGGAYNYDAESHRVTCYVKGEPVGWAYIGADKVEGSLECLYYYAIAEANEAEDELWALDYQDMAHSIDWMFEAANHLYEKGACDTGGLLPQFLASPHNPHWPALLRGNKAWVDDKLHGLLCHYSSFVTAWKQAFPNKDEEDDIDLPDWLQDLGEVPQVEAAPAGAFDDLEDLVF